MNKPNRKVNAAIISVALSLAVRGALADPSISYTPGTTYTQNFDSLATSTNTSVWTNNTTPPINTEAASVLPVLIGTAVGSPVDLSGGSADVFHSITNISTMGGWYVNNFGGNSLPLNYLVSDGSNPNATSNSSAGVYGFFDPAKQVTGTPNNMALGGISASDTGNIVFGMKLVNTGTLSLNAISISYTGELFHQDSGAKSMTFGYLLANGTVGATIPLSGASGFGGLNIGGFTPSAPGVSGSSNLTQSVSAINLPLSSNWAPGQALWITWQMGVGGSGQGLGIDDLSFSASQIAAQPVLTWNHAGDGTWDLAATNWSGASTVFANGYNVAFPEIAGDVNVAVDAGGVLPDTSITVNNSANKYTFSGGPIGGAHASLIIAGGGTVQLTAPNTYGTATNINSGKLIVSDNNQLGASTASLNLAGGVLGLAGTLAAGTRTLNVNSASTINLGGFTGTFGATPTSLPIIHAELDVTGSGNLNLGIQPTFGSNAAPAGSLRIDAGSTVTLLGNTRASATDMWNGGVFNGTLVIATTAGGRFNFDSVGTFNMVDGTSTGSNGSSVISGTGQIQIQSGSKWTVVSGKAQLDSNGVVISNTSGAMGANIGVNIHLNSLEGTDGAHPAFVRTDVTSPNAYDGSVHPAGAFISVIGGTKNNGTGKGGIGAGFSTLIISGVISGDSDINVGNDYKSGGSGNLMFSNHNTYHGVTMLNGGGTGTPVLYMGIDNALPSDTDVVFGTIPGAGTPSLDLNGHSQVIRSLSVSLNANSPNLNQINNSGLTPATLTITGAVTPLNPFNGQINDLGPTATDPLGGNFTAFGGSTTALVKDGTSTFVLGQYLDSAGHFTLSTYSGGTTVKGGTLQIPWDGALGAATGPMTFDGGTVSVQNPFLKYNNPLTLETSSSWTSARLITVTPNGGTINTPTFLASDGATNHSLVASVFFTGAGGYNWGGPLHLSGATGSVMTINGGTGSVTVNPGASMSVDPTVSLTIGGTSDPLTDSVDSSKHVALQVTGSLTFNGSTLYSAGTISGTGSLQVEPTATLNSNAINIGSLTVNGTHVIQPGSGSNRVNSPNLTIASSGGTYSGKLDLTNNKLVVEGTDDASASSIANNLRNAVASGYAGGTWTGKGITSSTVATDVTHGTSMAIAIGSDLSAAVRTTLGVDTTGVVVVRSVLGDVDLNGTVGTSDLIDVYNNFGSSNGKWTSGAMERSNTTGRPLAVGTADLIDVYNHFGGSTPAMTSGGGLHEAGLGGSVTVPEPTSLSILAVAGAALLERHRRKALPEVK